MEIEDHPHSSWPPQPKSACRTPSASSVKENDLPASMCENEHEFGHIIYEVCQGELSIWDEEAGSFSISNGLQTANHGKQYSNIMSQLGAPFAATYLPGLPDHYTNLQFKVCYWQSYVNEIEKIWKEYEETNDHGDILDMATVLIYKAGNNYKATSPLYDYVYHPEELEEVCLYDYVSLHEKVRAARGKATATHHESSDASGSESESENEMET